MQVRPRYILNPEVHSLVVRNPGKARRARDVALGSDRLDDNVGGSCNRVSNHEDIRCGDIMQRSLHRGSCPPYTRGRKFSWKMYPQSSVQEPGLLHEQESLHFGGFVVGDRHRHRGCAVCRKSILIFFLFLPSRNRLTTNIKILEFPSSSGLLESQPDRPDDFNDAKKR